MASYHARTDNRSVVSYHAIRGKIRTGVRVLRAFGSAHHGPGHYGIQLVETLLIVDLIDARTGEVIPSLGETHAAKLEEGVCCCGWTASGPYTERETWDHLYGGLTWIPAHKLARFTGSRPLAIRR